MGSFRVEVVTVLKKRMLTASWSQLWKVEAGIGL